MDSSDRSKRGNKAGPGRAPPPSKMTAARRSARGTSLITGEPSTLGAGETPRWAAEEGNLYWRGELILHLAAQARTERALLDAFEKRDWRLVIPDPLPRETIGDPTQPRRSAIANLNRRLGADPPFRFFSTHNGSIGWQA